MNIIILMNMSYELLQVYYLTDGEAHHYTPLEITRTINLLRMTRYI
jgi:hypothetical protein